MGPNTPNYTLSDLPMLEFSDFHSLIHSHTYLLILPNGLFEILDAFFEFPCSKEILESTPCKII